VNEEGKKVIPVNKIYSIYAYGRISFTSGVISYLGKYGVCIHFYNYYGFYEGSFYPRESLLSGELLVKQVEYYLNSEKRIYLARKIVEGSGKNIMKNLKTYSIDTDHIEKLLNSLEEQNQIPNIMNIEGRIRDFYYSKLDEILKDEFKILKRERRPPTNMTNSLLSFGNQLLYGTIVSEIYNTQLNPTISYLHEPFERRFSLALDVSEIFKPIIVDRIILKLINKGMIDNTYFRKEMNSILLNEKGKKLFIKEYEDKLQSTVKHKGLKRNVSYQRLIRLELYKIIKHLLGIQEYKPFVMWW